MKSPYHNSCLSILRIATWLSAFILPSVLTVNAQLIDTYPGASWQKANPKTLGWSAEKLMKVTDYAQTLGPGGLMIIDGGKVITDWGDTDQRHKVSSVRKSLLSALYGIHAEAGRIDLTKTLEQLGIDDNAPALTPAEKQATIQMLLQSRSGVYHDYVSGTPAMRTTQPARYSHAPGTHWYYNNWDFNALGTIFEQQLHTKMATDFQERIARPLRMQDFRLEDQYYVTAKESIYPAYPFRMTVRDLARFGYLYLRQGKWEGKQIVPANWIKESTQSYSDAGENGGYGYLWWVAQKGHHFPGVTLEDGSYSARGAGGKYIVVLPVRDLVIVYCTNVDYPDHAEHIAASEIPRGITSAEMGHLLNLILQAKPQP
ncbi:serine hydrolase domain-containing protein [Spirosoma gilvum]